VNTESSQDQRRVLREMTRMAQDLRDALAYPEVDIDVIGDFLHQGWMHKRELASGISDSRIDTWYECARRNGATGGKILGAGGGGFLLLYAHPDRYEDIATALPELRQVSFGFEPQGSRIVYVEEGDY